VPDYHPQDLDKKWQARWHDSQAFEVVEDPLKPKFYCLEMFAYPSGHAHVGHVRNYIIGDVVARLKRLQGFNVLHPFGWDAFGLPAENAAIKSGIHPETSTLGNIAHMKGQLQRLGISYAWGRELATCLPDYYRWNQWLFIRMFERGLAYRRRSTVNWCPVDNTVLANEQVVDGACWRCGTTVEQKDLEQWFFRITAYADDLLASADQLSQWPDKVLTMQRNWIGRSEGARVAFALDGWPGAIEVFTTRIDTIFGATFLLLGPEHPLAAQFADAAPDPQEFRAQLARFRGQDRAGRVSGEVEKEGFFTGHYATNPFSGERVPVWVANFVLGEYGTGAVMGVPFGDQRDFEFARKYDLTIRAVIRPADGGPVPDVAAMTESLPEEGLLVNSGPYDGLTSAEGRRRLTAEAKARGLGEGTVQYRLKDWGISRQRYWGTPIPMIHCPACGVVPVRDDQLPVELPKVAEFTGRGDSPLAAIAEFVNVACPTCGGAARRETDTMPNWAGSSWYFLRYTDPDNDAALADPARLKYWTPVDWYNGGMEHTTLHLLYSRFWHKFLYDIGMVPTSEPYTKRTSHGLILGENGEKMSKSRGNVVNPDDVVERFGADAFRLYEVFMGAFDQPIPWSTNGLVGMWRFLQRVWDLAARVAPDATADADTNRLLHQTIRHVDERIESMKFNTAVAALMTFANHLGTLAEIPSPTWETFLVLLGPFAPHITEELWRRLGHDDLVATRSWPEYDPEQAREEVIEIAVQINGKVRSRVTVSADADRETLEAEALADDRVKELLTGKTVRKVIVVPGRLVNIVAG